MILIYPPVAKPCEPPAGVAKLSGALSRCGIKHKVIDANIEGLLSLLQQPQVRFDTWTNRASRNLEKNLAALRDRTIYSNVARYKRAVMDINRVLEKSTRDSSTAVSLANYRDNNLSPLRSRDLLRSAEYPERSPFYTYFERRLSSVIEREQPSTVGISINFLSQALCAFAMIGFLKKRYPDITIVLGGGLVTSWVRGPKWHNHFRGLVDRFVAGPGEYELPALLGSKDMGKEHVAPRYDQLPLAEYVAPGLILPYSGSSGCYWNKCSFCPERAEGNPYIPVADDMAAEDLRMLARLTRPALIHILDNSMRTGLMRALMHNPSGVPWYGFARIGRDLTDDDFCMALKRSGCVMLKLGLESGDQGVLDHMHKGIDLETASRALRALKRAGIATYVYLLFGTPPETEASARMTLEFTARHSDAISFLNLAIFNMPLYGPEAEQFGTGSFYEGDLSLYTDFRHPKGWNRKQVRLFLENDFKRHPAIAPIMQQEPPFFTSNHAPLFSMEQR